MAPRAPAILTLATLFCFLGMVLLRDQHPAMRSETASEVVLPAPVQIVLYAGDRYLAANIEAVRAAVAGQARDANRSTFQLRAHRAVAELNPCHEDNYWIGNASLTWGGRQEAGMELLELATHCRYWDELPPFFYGFNRYFFWHDIAGARISLETAADRSTQNAPAYRSFAIMITAEEIDDAQLALNLIEQERKDSHDPRLRDMLAKRIDRLKGLIILRRAQEEFESRFKKPLTSPQELLDKGLLQSFPEDPLKLGYEFRDHKFHLRQAQIEY